MKRFMLILIAIIWLVCLTVLIIALTDVMENGPFKDYRLIIGIGFIAISRLLGMKYKRLVNLN